MDEFEDMKKRVNLMDIKSVFIIKNIFSFLSESKILNMIMCNKKNTKDTFS